MSNWGQPDFDVRTSKQQAIDAEAPNLRARLKAEGKMDCWPYQGPLGFDHATVRRYCVDVKEPEVRAWQQVRLSMKGKPTHEKLAILKAWWDKHILTSEIPAGAVPMKRTAWGYAVFVQVYNYLGALRRGGQLDSQNRVRTYM